MVKLVRLAQNQGTDAFAELMQICEQDMYRIARSFLQSDADIADAMQETILACFENLHKLQNPAHFKTWMIRILINKCNDVLRASKKIISLESLPEESRTDTALANVEFEMLMDSLDELYRTALVLRYGEGLSVREISEVLKTSESSVKQRLKRGRDKAKELFRVEQLSPHHSEKSEESHEKTHGNGEERLIWTQKN